MATKQEVFDVAFKNLFDVGAIKITEDEKQRMFIIFCVAWNDRQAQIDSLMLEHCPDEMTPEQLEEWGKHQKASTIDLPEFNVKLSS